MLQAVDVRARPTTRGLASLSTLLESGGDHRISVDPTTGRNKYGVPTGPADHEIWLSSSTASAVSRRGFEAAEAAFDKLLAGGAKTGETIEQWFDRLRARISALVDVDGMQVILCASGTETELLALALSRHLLSRPLTNLVIGVQESGAGVPQAAAGAHFDTTTALDGHVQIGRPLLGWSASEIEVVKVDIRTPQGELRSLDDIDAAVRREALSALDSGRDVQVHILDASKTGRGGPRRAAATALLAEHPDHVSVVVDACQLRCSFDDIRADLERGFMVMITGSKFVGGPPFCGALLVPPTTVDRLRGLNVPAGLTDYSARFDWPPRLRHALGHGDFASCNLGLGLRWEAALAEIESYLEIMPDRRDAVMRAFGRHVEDLVRARPHLRLLDAAAGSHMDRPQTIFPIVSGDGAPDRAASLHRALRESIDDGDEALARICHVGQPVRIADRAALRVCIGMPLIRRVAERLERMPLQQAFAPVAEELATLFHKWDLLEVRLGAESLPAIADLGASPALSAGEMRAVFETAHPDEPLDKAGALRLMSAASRRTPMALAKELFALARGPGRLSFRDYVDYRLFDDAFVAGASKSAFIGRRRNQELNAEINYRHEWNCIADDKIATAAYLGAYGLPVIPTIGVYAPHMGRRAKSLSKSHPASLLDDPSDLRAFLSDPANYPMFGKPTDGLQSLGSIALKSLDTKTGLIETSTSTVAVEAVVAAIGEHFKTGYMFQPRLTTHADVAAALGRGLSTTRLVTIATADGPKLFASAWKLLGGTNVADNYWRAGNILAAFDPSTGRVKRATTGHGFGMREIEHHPTTGATLKDLVLPMCAAAVETALEGHRALGEVGIIGWDIGVTDQGPVIVEANVTPDLLLVQAANRTGAYTHEMIELLKRQKAGAKARFKVVKATWIKD